MVPSGGRPDAGELSARLCDRLEALVADLLPDGKIEAHEWTARGPDGGRWGVALRGAKRGRWCDWHDPSRRGDPLDLVRWAVCDGNLSEACRWARGWLGDGAAVPRPAARARPAATPAVDPARRRLLARERWHQAQPLAGSPAAHYLRGRGLSLETPALRYAPRVWHAGLERSLPALLGAVVLPAGGPVVAVHITYLELAGDRWRKLGARPAKIVLGGCRGGVIPLAAGASGQALRHAPPGDTIMLAEGIEDAGTMAAAFPEHRVAAAISVGNLAAVALPPTISTVIMVLQRDGENSAVQHAREVAVERWLGEGREVGRWQPPRGFKDANEYWQSIATSNGR
jgi:Toprim domain